MNRRPKIDYHDFRSWLISQKRYASDVISRCKRVERILGEEISTLVSSPAKIEQTFDQLEARADEYLPPTANKKASVGVLKTAIRLAGEFFDFQAQSFIKR